MVPGYPSGFIEETVENIPASSGHEEQRAVGADKCTGFVCTGPWKHVAALLYFLGGRCWHLSPKLGVAVEEAAQGRRRPSQTPVSQRGDLVWHS